jgi:hypothetical protein
LTERALLVQELASTGRLVRTEREERDGAQQVAKLACRHARSVSNRGCVCAHGVDTSARGFTPGLAGFPGGLCGVKCRAPAPRAVGTRVLEGGSRRCEAGRQQRA